jgi:hypothetical protein
LGVWAEGGGTTVPDFRLPLSGNVMQSINPWQYIFNPSGSQVGLFNINLGNSSNIAVEEEVLSDVASYGKQLGRIGDVLQVLLAHFHPERPLAPEEENSIRDLQRMLEDIAKVGTKAT